MPLKYYNIDDQYGCKESQCFFFVPLVPAFWRKWNRFFCKIQFEIKKTIDSLFIGFFTTTIPRSKAPHRNYCARYYDQMRSVFSLRCRMNQMYGGNTDNRIHRPGLVSFFVITRNYWFYQETNDIDIILFTHGIFYQRTLLCKIRYGQKSMRMLFTICIFFILFFYFRSFQSQKSDEYRSIYLLWVFA
jgi:hypothetical protein